MKSSDSDGKPNHPSIGLKLWGPLVPANDCKPCLGALAFIQAFAGSYIGLRLGRRVLVSRSKGLNFITKTVGTLTGTYLVFTAATEMVRLTLPYDPWIIDAEKARQDDIAKRRKKINSTFTKYVDWKYWHYLWAGPPNYTPVPWSEWKKRAISHLEKASVSKIEASHANKIIAELKEANMHKAKSIQKKIHFGELKEPHFPMNYVVIESDDDDLTEDEIFDSLDLGATFDLWNFFVEPRSFSLVILPKSSTAWVPNMKQITNAGTVQNVNYAPMPQYIKRF